MRGLDGAAVIPGAPLMVPAASPDQPADIRGEVAELRHLANRALADLPDSDVVVLVAAGPRGIFDRAIASLAPLGVEGAEVELPVATDAVDDLSRLTQYPMFRGDPLTLSHSALALQLHAVRGTTTVLPVNVPPNTDFEVLVSVGASIGEAFREAGLVAAVVAAGDLSAGLSQRSPAHAIEGASQWDAAVVAAVKDGDLRRLAGLGPDAAERVRALGWAPLAVVHGVCAAGRLTPQLLGYGAPRGVGELVALCVGAGRGEQEPYEVAATQREGVVRRTGDRRG
ncbi:MAG: hypothetical protein KY462_14105 [Actinobacteria bacterium]|nr:hypothetical protein [Actinomycetota bacterium]